VVWYVKHPSDFFACKELNTKLSLNTGLLITYTTDPLEMFRQIAPTGEVTRTRAGTGDPSAQIDAEERKPTSPKQENKFRLSGLVVSHCYGLAVYCDLRTNVCSII